MTNSRQRTFPRRAGRSLMAPVSFFSDTGPYWSRPAAGRQWTGTAPGGAVCTKVVFRSTKERSFAERKTTTPPCGLAVWWRLVPISGYSFQKRPTLEKNARLWKFGRCVVAKWNEWAALFTAFRNALSSVGGSPPLGNRAGFHSVSKRVEFGGKSHVPHTWAPGWVPNSQDAKLQGLEEKSQEPITMGSWLRSGLLSQSQGGFWHVPIRVVRPNPTERSVGLRRTNHEAQGACAVAVRVAAGDHLGRRTGDRPEGGQAPRHVPGSAQRDPGQVQTGDRKLRLHEARCDDSHARRRQAAHRHLDSQGSQSGADAPDPDA